MPFKIHDVTQNKVACPLTAEQVLQAFHEASGNLPPDSKELKQDWSHLNNNTIQQNAVAATASTAKVSNRVRQTVVAMDDNA